MIKLFDIETSANPAPIAQDNFELIDDALFSVTPTDVNTLNSGPVAGAHVLKEAYIDQNLARWVCTVAGTPGTWKQITPAVVDASPAGTIATGYWVVRRDLLFRHYRYSGAAWVEILAHRLSNSAALDFPNIAASGGSQDLTITVTGAAVGDLVALGLPAAPDAGVTFCAWVSAADTVTVRATNCTGAGINPASATFRVMAIPY